MTLQHIAIPAVDATARNRRPALAYANAVAVALAARRTSTMCTACLHRPWRRIHHLD
jgi:hypothetical protein